MTEEEILDRDRKAQDPIEASTDAKTDAEAAEILQDQEPGDETVDVDSLESQLSEAREQAAEYLDGWQRARAEFANAKKRLERERAEAYRNAAVDYASKLLPSLDDFDRAIDNVPDHIEADGWFAGITLVRRKLNGLLENLRVEPIEALGQPFDPNYHEALALKEEEGIESGIVIEELQTGYKIDDRVIRPSLVNVSA